MTSDEAYFVFLEWLHLLRFKSINSNFSVVHCQIHLRSVKISNFGISDSVQRSATSTSNSKWRLN